MIPICSYHRSLHKHAKCCAAFRRWTDALANTKHRRAQGLGLGPGMQRMQPSAPDFDLLSARFLSCHQEQPFLWKITLTERRGVFDMQDREHRKQRINNRYFMSVQLHELICLKLLCWTCHMLCAPGSKETKRVDLCHAEGCSSQTFTMPDTSYTVASFQDASFHENTLYDRPEEVGHIFEFMTWIDRLSWFCEWQKRRRLSACGQSIMWRTTEANSHTLTFIVEAGVMMLDKSASWLISTRTISCLNHDS